MSEYTLVEIIVRGGVTTWIILAIALLALFLVLERFLSLRRAQIDVQDFLPGVINTLRTQDVKQAVIICDESPGPAARIVRQAIIHAQDGREAMHQATREAALSELPRLERCMNILLVIAHVAPMLGLLGTVNGMISVFQDIDASGTNTFLPLSNMADGIWQALISTAAGMTVAIPTYISYNLFREQIDNVLVEMDKAAVEIIHFLCVQPQSLPLDEAGAHEDSGTAAAVDEPSRPRDDDTQVLKSVRPRQPLPDLTTERPSAGTDRV